jgi:hypothetical protein
MRDESGGLPGEDEIVSALRAPGLDGIEPGRPVKDAVEFGGAELAGVRLQLPLEREAFREERPRREA